MKEIIKNLCEYVISNDGVMPKDTITEICKDMDCDDCPFGLSKMADACCYKRNPISNIKIAQEYINDYYKDSYMDIYNQVNSPTHYNVGKIEVIEAIEEWKLNFNLGNAIKYIARCEHKENKKQDLEKAKWYIEREIKKCK